MPTNVKAFIASQSARILVVVLFVEPIAAKRYLEQADGAEKEAVKRDNEAKALDERRCSVWKGNCARCRQGRAALASGFAWILYLVTTHSVTRLEEKTVPRLPPSVT